MRLFRRKRKVPVRPPNPGFHAQDTRDSDRPGRGWIDFVFHLRSGECTHGKIGCGIRPPLCSRCLTPFLLVLRSQATDSLTGSPDFELTDLLHLLLESLAVVWTTSVLHGALRLLASLDRVVEVIEDGLEGLLEALAPVNGTTAGRGGAGGVHVVHTVGTNQRVERLCGLLDSLVECL